MSRLVTTIAVWSAARRWWVVASWVVLATTLVTAALLAGRGLDDSLVVPGSDSAAAAALLEPTATGAGRSTLLLAADEPLTDERRAATVADVVGRLETMTGAEVANPLDAPAAAQATGRLSPDGRALRLTFETDASTLDEQGRADAEDVVAAARDAGLTAAYGGELGRRLDPGHGHVAELVGIVAAVVVLTLSLGSVAAMLLPVVTGVLAVTTGLAVVHLVGHVVAVPAAAPTLATMIGLGVGIDYALFLVARQRRALRDGAGPLDAVARTAATSGAAVAFAGATVAVAVCGLTVTGVAFVSWLGLATAIVVLVVLLASTTLTPALLAVLGDRLRERTRPARPRAGGGDGAPGSALETSGWGRLADRVTRRPAVVTGVATLLLLGLSVPMVFLDLGQSTGGALPTGTHQRTFHDANAAHFGAGSAAELTVVVGLRTPASGPDDERLLRLGETLRAGTDAAAVSAPRLADDAGTVATLVVTPREDANAASTAALLTTVRDVVAADAAVVEEGTAVHVGGTVAVRIDLAERIAARLPWLVAAVLVLSTLLLAVAFRSVVLPLKAALMNLLSVGAAYGVVVVVFQWGHGASWIGLDGPVPIDSYVPMMLFVVLFGLSMDYEVFLLSAVRDHHLATDDTTLAIRRGLAETGRVITSAALIMVTVFASFVLVDDPTIKVFGVGLAVAVVVDATVVRCLLVPALMTLLGAANWWWPGGVPGSPAAAVPGARDAAVHP